MIGIKIELHGCALINKKEKHLIHTDA